MCPKLKLDKQMNVRAADSKFSRERRDTKELANGQEQGLKLTVNHDIISKIFLNMGLSVYIYSPQNSEKLKCGDKS
jgi:hypothetical protein